MFGSSTAANSIIGPVSRFFRLTPGFHDSLIHLLELGYKVRHRLPLLICASFVFCHLFSHVPNVEINIEVIDDDPPPGDNNNEPGQEPVDPLNRVEEPYTPSLTSSEEEDYYEDSSELYIEETSS